MARVKTSDKGQYESFVGEENEKERQKEGEENLPERNAEDEVAVRHEEEVETEKEKNDKEEGGESKEEGGESKEEGEVGKEDDSMEEEEGDVVEEEQKKDEEGDLPPVEEETETNDEEAQKSEEEDAEKNKEEDAEKNKEDEEEDDNEEVEEENKKDEEEEEGNNEEEEGGDDDGEEEEGNHQVEEEEGNNDEEEDEENTAALMEEVMLDGDDESQPMQPERMCFPQSEYTKMCTIASRCVVGQTVKFIEKFKDEVGWFKNHCQFKHIFHMPKEPNHMAQGMWMLLLRTADTEMDRECWFVVNGVPIRYSIKEHALLSGLLCHEYPNKWEELGSTKFAEKVFKKSKGVTIKEVEAELAAITSTKSVVRKKLLILYFLFKVIKAKSRGDGLIDPFLLRIVDDVHACETFPWGRYTFEISMDGIRSVMKKMKGYVKRDAQTSFPGFLIPLEILAFECIPSLGEKFRKEVSARDDCPRMCKHKFKNYTLKGFALEEINKTLGDSKEVISILEPTADEIPIVEALLDEGVDDGIGFVDPIVDGWRHWLLVQKKKIVWEDMFQKDVKAREEGCERIENAEQVNPGVRRSGRRTRNCDLPLKEAMEKGFADVLANLRAIKAKVDEVDMKVGVLDDTVKELKLSYAMEVPVDTHSPFFTPTRDAPRREGGEDNVNEKTGDQDEDDNGQKKAEEEKRSKKKRKDKKKGKKKKVDSTVITTGKKRRRIPTNKFTPVENKKKRQKRK